MQRGIYFGNTCTRKTKAILCLLNILLSSVIFSIKKAERNVSRIGNIEQITIIKRLVMSSSGDYTFGDGTDPWSAGGYQYSSQSDPQPAEQKEPERTSPEIQDNQWTPDKPLPSFPDPPGDRANSDFGSNNDRHPATVTEQPATKETTHVASSNNGLRLEDQFRKVLKPQIRST